MKKELLSFLFVSIAGIGFAQVTFQKTYGYAGDVANDVKQTRDGGYIITGEEYFGTGIYIIRTDSTGDTLWTRTLGASYVPYGNSVQQTTDGGFIIAGGGAIPSAFEDVYLLKLDSTGTPAWTEAYGGPWDDRATSVNQTLDGGYIIVGSSDFGAGNRDVYLVKTNSFGNLQWSKNYGGTADDVGYCVQQTTDSGYIITGYTRSFGAGGSDVYVIKTNVTGDTLWTKTIGRGMDEDGYYVRQTADGGYIIAGTFTPLLGNYDVYLVKLNAAGGLVWQKNLGGVGTDYGYCVQQTIDGGYIIAGTTYSLSSVHSDAYLIKTDSAGIPVWSKAFGGIWDDWSYSVSQTADGGYIIAGGTKSFGSGIEVVYLIKTDANGNSSAEANFCNEQKITTTAATPLITVKRPATIISFPPTSQSTPPDDYGSWGQMNSLCTISTGIQSTIINPQSAITISPNPSPNLFHISTASQIQTIEVYNYLGEEVFTSAGAKEEIDLTKAAAGIYFYAVGLKDGDVERGKLVKE